MFVMHGNIGFAADFIDCLLFSMTGSYFIPKWVLGPFWSWYDFGPYVIASRRKEASYGRCLLLSMASSWHWSGFHVINFLVDIFLFLPEAMNLIFLLTLQFGVFGICDGHGGAEAAKSASKLVFLFHLLLCFLGRVCSWLLDLSYFD